MDQQGPDAELPYLQRAIQLDPNFAMAYLVGRAYYSVGELFTKAFSLRQHPANVRIWKSVRRITWM